MNQQDYEEIMKLIEEDSQDWLLANAEEFEDIIDDQGRTFKWEFAHEGLTEKGSRFKKWRAE